MASTFSQTLRLELIGDGDQSGIWGQTTNNNLGALIEQAITGVVNITMIDANYTLTNFNGVEDEARNAVLVLGGTNAAVRDVITPLVEKVYVVRNTTSGNFAVNIRAATGASVSIPNGATVLVYCDGTNFNAIGNESVGNFEVNGNLTVTGNTNAVAATYTGNVAALNLSTANVVATGNVSATNFSATGNVSATGNATATNFIGGGLTLTSINASNISAGTIANARTTANSANGASTIVVRDSDGSFAANVGTFVTVSGAYSGNGAGLTDINASNISSGTISNARTTAASANGASTIVARDSNGSFAANVVTVSNVAATVGFFADGTAAAPSITNTGDENTGIFFPAADTIAFSEGGVESVRIDANGNVGIGNTDPSFSLGPYEGMVMQSQGVSSQFRLYTSESSGLTDANGAGFTVFGKTLFISNKENADMVFETNGLQNMRLKPSGNLEVGGTVSGQILLSRRIDAAEGGQIDLEGGSSYTGFNKSIDVFAEDLRFIGPGNWSTVLFSTTGTASLSVQGPAAASNFGLGLSGQTWNNVTGSRALVITYTNTRSYPIMISVNGTGSGSSGINVIVNGTEIYRNQAQWNGSGAIPGAVIIIPPSATYSVTMSTSGLNAWWELY